MTDRRRYGNAPIDEAVCEFRFGGGSTVGWAVLPGRLYERLTDTYPAQPQADGINAAAGFAQPTPNLPNMQLRFVVGAGPPNRVRLANEDSTELLLVGEPNLAVSDVRPYSGWEKFSERIRKALQAFAAIEGEPLFLDRIGIRYINSVEASLDDLENYFDIRPLMFKDLSLSRQNFISRSELLLDGDPNQLVIAAFASTVGEDGKNRIVLDIDVVNQNLNSAEGYSVDEALSIVEDLRAVERRVFEAAITEDARNGPFGGYEVIQ